jgi:hypothetical protein
MNLNALDLTSCRRSGKTAYVGYPPLYNQDLTQTFVEVSVIEYDNSDECSTWKIANYNYYRATLIEEPNRLMALSVVDLPLLERLIQAFKISISDSPIVGYGTTNPFSRLQRAVASFAQRYCNTNCSLPLVRNPRILSTSLACAESALERAPPKINTHAALVYNVETSSRHERND